MGNMLLLIVRVVYLLVCSGAIATFVSPGTPHPEIIDRNPLIAFVVLLGLSQLVVVVDWLFRRKRVGVISAIYFGLLVGVLLSYLLILALQPVITDSPLRNGIAMLVTLMLPYLCTSLLLQTKDDFRFIIPYVEFARELRGGRPLILDSSALIDGRIADVVETKIPDSELVVPDFVLREVQEIADSHDKVRRGRGRRGLDVLSKLQNSANAEVRIHDADESDGRMTIDQRIVQVAKQVSGRVLTNDFSLNKVANLQGVDVINLNDVANSLKPRYLPGERLRIRVIKEGESHGQGVGYLDDGTMVVCEAAAPMIGRDIECLVTSVLQSSAGRMIFAKPVEPEQRRE